MPNVIVDKNKLDILANAIYAKSGESLTLTLDEMVEAVDGIENYHAPTLETVTKTYTPTTSQQTDTITPSSGYDGIEEVDVTVSAVPLADVSATYGNTGFITESNVLKWKLEASAYAEEQGWVDEGEIGKDTFKCNAVASNTSITPTESSQTVGGYQYMMQGAVTVNAIPSNYVGSGITQRSSSDLTASGATVTVPSGYYSAQASKSVSNGTTGTPTATKGTVSNHSVSVTPSVTNTTGWITGSTINGTAVTVSASELVSGSDTVTTNDTYDVTNLAELIVNVAGGGVTVTDEANTTGITCVITSGGTPPTPTGWETMIDGSLYVNSGDPYGNMWIADLGDVSISVGSVWRITFDGNSYVVTATNQGVYPSPRDGIIGNPLYMGGQDDGSNVPFCFEQNPWGAWTGGTASSITGDTSHNVKIERQVSS